MIQKMIWYAKQLLPLTYVSTYKVEGAPRLTVWNMWFGKSYNIQNFNLDSFGPGSGG